mgnify:CR=1 FL=1
MTNNSVLKYIEEVLANIPSDWLRLTTHRLDIYEEKLAKTQFLEQFESLINNNDVASEALAQLPTAYDYIRLGHPLSSVLEWTLAQLNKLPAENVISFSSQTIPIMAVLRKNLLEKRNTRILYTEQLPPAFDEEALQSIYGYQFEVLQVENATAIDSFEGSTIFLSDENDMSTIEVNSNIDFYINSYSGLGSVLLVNAVADRDNSNYIAEIQHVRRRETIAMTPANCLAALKGLVKQKAVITEQNNIEEHKAQVISAVKNITGSNTRALVGSSGLSVQYAIMMGLIDDAQERHPEKGIRFIVPPNCYGGTNDQARRVAACLNHVQVLDLPVDGDHDMAQSIEMVLAQCAKEDTVPYIIAEIPTNPRVEIPDLVQLKKALSTERITTSGSAAIAPVFILDQTFCPNVHFLSKGSILSDVQTISYVSGSKFPSGGLCTAGYCVGNDKTAALMAKIEKHLRLCDNEATGLQYELLARQMPSMNQRIDDAYNNTREFVNFIRKSLPEAKINFVSEELAQQGFTPSVFSLDLPTQGNTHDEREAYKRELNHRLIKMMITEIPDESKYCVSYGQLKGCYWTIPATSTQGTTKESDKDYIARIALSANMDLELHKKVFSEFVKTI